MRRAAAALLCALCLYALAVPTLAQRSRRGPSEAQRLYLEGKQAADARDYPRAEEMFGKALQRVTHLATRANVLNDLGETLYELERFDEARDAFVEALSIRPNFTRAQANLAIVGWALPPVEEEPRERLSNRATFVGQVVGSYLTGAVVGGWFIFFGRVMGYQERDGQLALMGAGLVFGSTLRVAQFAEDWNYGHGAQRNAVAGAFVGPLAGAFAVMVADGDAGRASQVRGARIGAYFSPVLATAGYAISTSRMFGGKGSAGATNALGTGLGGGRHGPSAPAAAVLTVPIAEFSF